MSSRETNAVGSYGRRLASVVVLIASALMLVVSTASAQGLKYRVPEGLLNLSPGAPAENFAKVPAPIAEQARAFHGYAVALKDGQPLVTFAVELTKSDANIPRLADEIVKAVRGRKDVENPRIVAHEKVMIAGFECAKVEYVVTVAGREFTKLFYILPVGPERAMMMLDGTSADVAAVRAQFESSVKSVSGLAAPSTFNEGGAVLVGMAALLLVLGPLAYRYAGKKKRKSTSNSRN